MAVTSPKDELLDLLGTLCNGTISAEEEERLGSLLGSDPDARQLYVKYLDLHLTLTDLDLQAHTDSDDVLPRLLADLDSYDRSESSSADLPYHEQGRSASVLPFLPPPLHGAPDYLASGWPMAYLVATVVVGVGLVIAAITHVSQPIQITTRSRSAMEQQRTVAQHEELVGRITGMVDCKWADESTATFNGASVSFGRRYDLSSGLLEITYDTGAKVILQGPVEYEVESKNGGFLPVGKLTGKVENELAKGFSVRTPTATITDLGTEFGVEVNKQGNTVSHVFRGSIRVQAVAAARNADSTVKVLHENESASVGRSGTNCVIIVGSSIQPTNFVRTISNRVIKTFDLVDVVAGGDGFSMRRGKGIDATTGRTSNAQPNPPYLTGDSKYHRAQGLPFVDGVFIPDSRGDRTQVTSTGITFDGFLPTDNRMFGHIWAGGKVPFPLHNGWSGLTVLNNVDYSAGGHCLLYMHTNCGITFDLGAIRRAHPGSRVARFRTAAGNAETNSNKRTEAYYADLWVLVDGQCQFRRRQISSLDKAFDISIPLQPSDRFLTLVTTDGGNGNVDDETFFGDPRLELQSDTPEMK